MELWPKINSELIKTCDKFATICEFPRYEDLVLRSDSIVGKGAARAQIALVKIFNKSKHLKELCETSKVKLLESFRHQKIFLPKYKFGEIEKKLTSWNPTLPNGINQFTIDSFSSLNRLGYHPTDKSDEQYRRELRLRLCFK